MANHNPTADVEAKKYTTENYGGGKLDCRHSLCFPGAGYKII